MKAINIGSQVSRLRKMRNLTQEELANHLGITKAAVSKWELGQSFPDISQLPKIASFFSVTVDELIDYKADLSSEEILEISTRISRKLPDDIEGALNECREYIRQYYSCPPLVFSLTHIMYSGAVWENPEEPDLKIVEEAVEYLTHVADTSEDDEIARNARFFLASLCLLQNEIDTAIEQFETLMPQQPLEIEASLAAAYEKAGKHDKALRIHQENLYWSANSALNSCLSLLTLADNNLEQISLLTEIAEPLALGINMNKQGSMQLLSYYFSVASAYKKIDENERAYNYLNKFADLAPQYKSFILSDNSENQIFSHIQDIVNPDLQGNNKEYFENTTFNMFALGLKQMMSSSPEWAHAADEEQYKEIAAKLEAL